MSPRVFASTGVLAVLIAVMSLAVRLEGQPVFSAANPWASLRTPDGQPDLQGVWSFATVTPLERPPELAGKEFLTDEEVAAIEARAARRRIDRAPTEGTVGTYNQFWGDPGTKVVATKRTSLIVDPPDGKLPPHTPLAQQKLAAQAAARARPPAGPEDLPIDERCIVGFNSGPPMLPGAYNNLVQIVQVPGYVVIFNEMVHDARIVPLDGRPHGSLQQWLGESRGRWAGNTLVVETKNFRPEGTGHPSTAKLEAMDENLHLVERFSRIGADTLLYEFTVEDPTAWTQPWTAAVPMNRTNDLIYEYACHEGNYSLSNILAGARAEEKAAEDGKKRR